MPSHSKKQHNLMAMVANNPAAAKRVGVPQKVGREFMKADKGRKFGAGGDMESKSMMKKEVAFMKKKGAPKSMIKHEEAEAKGMRKGGMACGTKKYGMGGMAYRGGGMAYAKGGMVRADGAAQRGKTKCKIC